MVRTAFTYKPATTTTSTTTPTSTPRSAASLRNCMVRHHTARKGETIFHPRRFRAGITVATTRGMTRLTQYAADEAISAQALLAMALKRIQRAERLRDRVVAMDEVRAARSLLALARE